jgi:transcriptional regulator with XRE-family HTH domain
MPDKESDKSLRDKTSRSQGRPPSDRPGSRDPFARWLRETREARGLTVRELAQRVGVSAAFITLIETGRKRPGPETIGPLARALGVEPAAIEAWTRAYRPRTLEEAAEATERVRTFLETRTPDPGMGLIAQRPLPGSAASTPRPAAERARGGGPSFAQVIEQSLRAAVGRPPARPPAEAVEPSPGAGSASAGAAFQVRLLPLGADPAAAPASAPLVRLDPVLLPERVSGVPEFAYRIDEEAARLAPDVLRAGDLALFGAPDWPPTSDTVYAVRPGAGPLLLGRVRLEESSGMLSLLAAAGGTVRTLPASLGRLAGRLLLVLRTP